MLFTLTSLATPAFLVSLSPGSHLSSLLLLRLHLSPDCHQLPPSPELFSVLSCYRLVLWPFPQSHATWTADLHQLGWLSLSFSLTFLAIYCLSPPIYHLNTSDSIYSNSLSFPSTLVPFFFFNFIFFYSAGSY